MIRKEILHIKMKVVTGLHIGVGGDKVQIGGIDSPVIKDPVSKLPYIPGSSIKGKLRCLLETEAGDEYDKGLLNEKINMYFGATTEYLKELDKIMDKEEKQKKLKQANGLSRFIFRDLNLADSMKNKFELGSIQMEEKNEVKIDRNTGKAADSGPRSTERIPPGTLFAGDILLRYQEETDLEEMLIMLQTAFKLLDTDFLGGSGSRGYGVVKVEHDIGRLLKAHTPGSSNA